MTKRKGQDRVSLMTLHAAKGLEFDTVFLPGWEDGLFPNAARARRERPRRAGGGAAARPCRADAGEEARQVVRLPSNRRIHGMWSSTIPSRFIDELPPDATWTCSDAPAAFLAHGASRFDRNHDALRLVLRHARLAAGAGPRSGGRRRPGQFLVRGRVGFQDRGGSFGGGAPFGGGGYTARRRWPNCRAAPQLIEGEIAGQIHRRPLGLRRRDAGPSTLKFGPGTVASGIDGNKLTVDFDKAGRKMVLDSFVERAG